MEHHLNPITAFVNRLIGPAVARLLELVGVHPHDQANPLPDYFVMTIVVMLLISVLVLWLKGRLSVDRPGAAQQIAESLLTNPMKLGLYDQLKENVRHYESQYAALVGTVALFILFSNLISVIPIFVSPTAFHQVPFACALITFLHFNYAGVRALGVLGYGKHFVGPIWWMFWLMIPVEVASTGLRLLSLTVRLWVNMFSSELIYETFLGLLLQPAVWAWSKTPALGVVVGIFPATLPLAFIALHIFVAVMQTYVFTLLPSLYIGMATSKEH